MAVVWDDIKISGDENFLADGYAAYSVENTGTVTVTLKENTVLSPGQERVFPYFPGHCYSGIVPLTWENVAGVKAITLKIFRITA